MKQTRKYNDDARALLKAGIDQVANAVKVTLGVNGRNVIYDKGFGNVRTTKDGHTVAKHIFVDDSLENVGAKIIKEVAQKTVDEAGDGTTTATVLSQAIIHSALKLISGGANPMHVKRGIDKAVEHVVERLKSMSIQVEFDDEAIRQVATISTNNDAELGKQLGDMVAKLGKDGRITAEISNTIETTTRTTEGYSFDKGVYNPIFFRGSEKEVIEMEDAYILLADKKITDMKSIIPICEQVMNTGKRNLLIITDDVNQDALGFLALNKVKGAACMIPIKAPLFGDRRTDMMTDMSVLTGASYLTDAEGVNLNTITVAHLGKAQKVILTKNRTIIVAPGGDKESIDLHIARLKEHDTEWSKDRIAMMTGGIGVISVGAPSEIEMEEKKDRVDDAICAMRAAMEEGISAGGGTAYIKAKQNLHLIPVENEDERSGVKIIGIALEMPLIQICKNGDDDYATALATIKNNPNNYYGYNAKTREFEDLVNSGIVDATKVLRVALEKAASVATMMMISECMIVDIPEKEEMQ